MRELSEINKEGCPGLVDIPVAVVVSGIKLRGGKFKSFVIALKDKIFRLTERFFL